MVRKIQMLTVWWVLALLCSGTLLVVSLEAQEHSPELTSEEEEETGEETRSYIAGGLFSLTDEIDSWFGDIRNEEQRQDDWIRLSTEVRFKTGDSIRFRQRVRAGFNLKEFSKRLRLVIEGDDGDALDDSEPVFQERTIDDFIRQNNRDGGSAALRYFFYKDRYTQLSADAGVRFSGGPNPFGRLRASHWIDLTDIWSIEPSQLFFLERDEGFGARTRLDLNRLIDADKFIRFRSEVYRSEESRGFEIIEELAYFRRLENDRSLSTSFAVFIENETRTNVDRYRYSVRYRSPLLGDWLYGVIEPGLEFPDERDYKLTPFIMLRLEGRFERAESENR